MPVAPDPAQVGGMLVYDDHLSVLSNQVDPVTGEVGIHTVNISFNGSTPWQIVPGGDSGVLGTYQQADGTALTPQIFQEITLRNVYGGVDLRLYSADRGVLEFEWLVAKAQDYEKIRIDFTGQDGLVFKADGSATLSGTDDLGNAVHVTVNTLADGSYSFGNLRPGTYAITETQPAGLLDGKDALGTAGGTLANDAATAITLAEGQTGGGYTFGEIAASSFSGAVFSDLNNDGAIDRRRDGHAHRDG